MFINEYRYDESDTRTALNAYNAYWGRKRVAKIGMIILAALSIYLYMRTGLIRFVVFAVIFAFIFCLTFLQIILGARYDAARIKEETGVPHPTIRYELDDEKLKVFRNGVIHVSIDTADIIGAKVISGATVVFTKGNYTTLFKDGSFLEGGATALRAFLREKGATIK